MKASTAIGAVLVGAVACGPARQRDVGAVPTDIVVELSPPAATTEEGDDTKKPGPARSTLGGAWSGGYHEGPHEPPAAPAGLHPGRARVPRAREEARPPATDMMARDAWSATPSPSSTTA